MKITKLRFLPLCAAILLAPAHAPARDTAATVTPNANLLLARQLNEAFVQVADQVSPCVVVITVTQKASSHNNNSDNQDDTENPWEQFRRFLRQRDGQEEPQPQERAIGQGSGVIIRKDGYILTNRHVVEDAEKIEVRLKDGRTFTGEVRGVDAPADVAVVKIDAKDLPVAKLADSSKTRVGEFAIAIGAPFALDYSVTFGHVSAKDRSNIIPIDAATTTMMDQSFIQTDANINPGNSGGPLVNIDGEVIGINTLIRGLRTGIGFAIPSNLAKEVADKLITDGKFTRSWLGIGIDSLREDTELREILADVKDGVVVRNIVSDGPAAKSNLRPADVITAVDGKAVVTSQQLKDEIRSKKVGQEVVLDVFRETRRGGKQMKITVKPGEWIDKTETTATDDTSMGDRKGSGNALGLSVKALNAESARKFNVDLTEGVIVSSVDKNGLADQRGIQEGDIITAIGDQPITSPRQFRDAIKGLDIKKGAIIHYISDGNAKFTILKEMPK
jgi:serine protease Do